MVQATSPSPDSKQKDGLQEVDLNRFMLDQWIENMYMEGIVMKRQTEMTDTQGSLELQRIVAALRFLIDEKKIRDHLLQDLADVEEDHDHMEHAVGPYCLIAFTAPMDPPD